MSNSFGPIGTPVTGIAAPRGTELSCRGWPQEAAYRMLQNNLDPEVAENPDQLVVYGGTGRAARSWDAYRAMLRTLETLERDETMLVQSGKPVGVMRTHEWAPRVLIANSNLVPDWANWDEFRRLEHQGLTMYGQMTAGSWIYIGTQGILQGTFECFAEIARKRFGGTLAGTLTITAGAGRHGRSAATRRDDERRRRAHHRRRPAHARASRRAPLPRRDRARLRLGRAARDARPRRTAPHCRWACSAMPPTSCPGCSPTASTPTSSPIRPAPTTR